MKIRNLMTLTQMNATPRATPKYAIPTRKQVKAKKDRAETRVKVDVRARCEERDGDCRIGTPRPGDDVIGDLGPCDGLPEWAHLGEKTRAKTRGQAPEVRHTTPGSLIACRRHHARIDGRERPRITVEALTKRGADGPLRFTETT